MGCGISRFKQDYDQEADHDPLCPFDADHHDRNHSQAKIIDRKSVSSRPNKEIFAPKSLLATSTTNSCSEDQPNFEIKTATPKKKDEAAEKNSDGGGSESGEHEDIDPSDKEEREEGLRFGGSPSFREYCNSEIGSRSIGNIVDGEREMYMSQMGQPPEVNKTPAVVQTVKKESSALRRILARSRQATKYSLLK